MPWTARYWSLRNKDPGMQRLADERVQVIFNQFTKSVERYCKGSYEDVFAIDQPLHKKPDQRLDFMMNVYQEIIKHATSKLSELEKERDRRL